MPLTSSSSPEAVRSNVEELVAAGRSPAAAEQAALAAAGRAALLSPGVAPEGHPNQPVADHLLCVGLLTSLDEGRHSFRSRSFGRAAMALLDLDHPVVSGLGRPRIPSIGASVWAVICQFLIGGTSDRYEALAAKWPPSIMTMTKVRGVGPVTAAKLYREKGLRSFDELLAAVRSGRVSDLKLGLEVLATAEVAGGRFPLDQAEASASLHRAGILRALGLPLDHLRLLACGSLRRRRPTVGDVDLVFAGSPDARASALRVHAALGEPLTQGETRGSVRVPSWGRRIQVDLWVVPERSFGAAVQYATGSRGHNERVRGLAKEQGMLLNEWGLWKRYSATERSARPIEDLVEDSAWVAGETEEGIYRALGLPFSLPTERNEG